MAILMEERITNWLHPKIGKSPKTKNHLKCGENLVKVKLKRKQHKKEMGNTRCIPEKKYEVFGTILWPPRVFDTSANMAKN